MSIIPARHIFLNPTHRQDMSKAPPPFFHSHPSEPARA